MNLRRLDVVQPIDARDHPIGRPIHRVEVFRCADVEEIVSLPGYKAVGVKDRVQCGHDVDVVSLMRGYMYAYGYQNISVAKMMVAKAKPEALACASCNACTVHCPRGFDVRERALDIARIHQVPDEFVA